MAASFSLPTVLANLAAGNQALSLIDGDFTSLYNPAVSLNTYGNYYVDVGAANALAITVSSPQTFTLTANLFLLVKVAAANTGATTLSINAGAAKSVVLPNGGALAANAMLANGVYGMVYDGTSWFLVGVPQSVPRSTLAGLTLSTAGGSATMTVAAGQASDSTNTALMNLGSSIGKTTSAWAVGTGNGGIDTGAIANSTWYHFYLIQRTDTGVTDVLFSLSASAPTMPASYTLKRRIGSGKTDGAAQWTAFVQDGDFFQWLAVVADISSNNPGTAAVTRTLTVPTGVRVKAVMNAGLVLTTTAGIYYALLSDLSTNDVGAGAVNANLSGFVDTATDSSSFFSQLQIMTNTSAQIRSRLATSSAATTLNINTTGWIDRRGQDS